MNKLKWVIVVVILTTTTIASFSQSYTHTPNDSVVANAVFDDITVFNIIQLNNLSDTLNFKWKKHNVSLPSTWEASICDVGHCYPTIVDSSTMDPVLAGDNGLISLHLNPHLESGTGLVQVLFWELSTPTLMDTLTWIISASNGVDIQQNNPAYPIVVLPNPAASTITINTPFDDGFHYEITDITGKQMLAKSNNTSQCIESIFNLSNGLYCVIIYKNKMVIRQKLSVNH